METISQDTYALNFSDDYRQLLVIESANGSPSGQSFDLTKGVKVSLENGIYHIEENQELHSDSEKTFIPSELNGIVAEPLRFEGDDWIGSEDLRDTRISHKEYKYHLKECAISLKWGQSNETLTPMIKVRTECPSGDCSGPPKNCLTVTDIQV